MIQKKERKKRKSKSLTKQTPSPFVHMSGFSFAELSTDVVPHPSTLRFPPLGGNAEPQKSNTKMSGTFP